MASSEKRCLYQVLGLSLDCTSDEIRSAYRRLALQRHPDKLVRSGVPEANATAGFQELLNAYEVLSDTRERAWYDSHRDQILSSSSKGSPSLVPDLFPFFSNSVYSGYSDTGQGFYKVYGDLFSKIFAGELGFAKKSGLPLPEEAPIIGNKDSPHSQVAAFYNHWLGFTTVLDFSWADRYDPVAWPCRKSRRVREDENKKLRNKARKEYMETVRGLAKFVKKRDKRVAEMQLKRNADMERKREEENRRKEELERQKAEKIRNYEEPEWSRIVEEDVDVDEDEDFVTVEDERTEFYCVVCSKKFKSDKQWKNHEQSKKHREKVAELREAFSEEDKEYEDDNAEDYTNGAGYLSVNEDEVDELVEQFEVNVGSQEDDNDSDNGKEIDDGGGDGNGDDDETSILEAMLSRYKNKSRNKGPKSKVKVDIDSDELEFMDYNDTKGSRRNRGGRRRNDRRKQEDNEEEKEATAAEIMKDDVVERNDEPDKHGDAVEPSSHPSPESETKKAEHSQQGANKKSTTKKENASKSKGRRRKERAT